MNPLRKCRASKARNDLIARHPRQDGLAYYEDACALIQCYVGMISCVICSAGSYGSSAVRVLRRSLSMFGAIAR